MMIEVGNVTGIFSCITQRMIPGSPKGQGSCICYRAIFSNLLFSLNVALVCALQPIM